MPARTSLLHISEVGVCPKVLPEVRELEGSLQVALDLAIPWEIALPVSFGGPLVCSNLLLELLFDT